MTGFKFCDAVLTGLFVCRTKLNYNPPKEDGSVYRIELQGVSSPIMKQILDYIFTGEVCVYVCQDTSRRVRILLGLVPAQFYRSQD